MSVSSPPLRETLEFIMKDTMGPFRMVCDVIGSLQHQTHELSHIKGVVGKLWMVPKGGMVTLREGDIKSLQSVFVLSACSCSYSYIKRRSFKWKIKVYIFVVRSGVSVYM